MNISVYSSHLPSWWLIVIQENDGRGNLLNISSLSFQQKNDFIVLLVITAGQPIIISLRLHARTHGYSYSNSLVYNNTSYGGCSTCGHRFQQAGHRPGVVLLMILVVASWTGEDDFSLSPFAPESFVVSRVRLGCCIHVVIVVSVTTNIEL